MAEGVTKSRWQIRKGNGTEDSGCRVAGRASVSSWAIQADIRREVPYATALPSVDEGLKGAEHVAKRRVDTRGHAG